MHPVSCSAGPSTESEIARPRGACRHEDRVKDHASSRLDKMAKIALATTDASPARPLLRGRPARRRARTPTTTRTRSTTSSRARAASRSAARSTSGSAAGDALVAPAGVEHGLVNDGTEPLLVLVVVTRRRPRKRLPCQRANTRSASTRGAAPIRIMPLAAVRASLMITCLGDLFFPEVGVAMVRLLRRLGVDRRLPARARRAAACRSSTPAITREAAQVAARTVELFAALRARGRPVGLLRVDGEARVPRAPAGRSERARPRERWPARTRELSQFLVEVLGVTRVAVDASAAASPTTTPAISCAGSASRASPRALLAGVAGVELVELPGRRRVLRLRGIVLGAAARGLDGHPRQEAGQRRERPAPTASSPATPAASCRWAAACRARDSRVRALHLAQVLAGETARER